MKRVTEEITERYFKAVIEEFSIKIFGPSDFELLFKSVQSLATQANAHEVFRRLPWRELTAFINRKMAFALPAGSVSNETYGIVYLPWTKGIDAPGYTTQIYTLAHEIEHIVQGSIEPDWLARYMSQPAFRSHQELDALITTAEVFTYLMERPTTSQWLTRNLDKYLLRPTDIRVTAVALDAVLPAIAAGGQVTGLGGQVTRSGRFTVKFLKKELGESND